MTTDPLPVEDVTFATSSRHRLYRYRLHNGQHAYVVIVTTTTDDPVARLVAPTTTTAYYTDDRYRHTAALVARVGDIPPDVILGLIDIADLEHVASTASGIGACR